MTGAEQEQGRNKGRAGQVGAGAGMGQELGRSCNPVIVPITNFKIGCKI